MMVGEKKAFNVRIRYREPGYELRRGREKSSPYAASYKISAVNEEAAIILAMEEFHELAKLSSVGWERVIVSVEATDAEESPG
jgi:hypothetical protein